LSWEEIKIVSSKVGFHLDREEFVETSYCSNVRSMMSSLFSCSFSTFSKPPTQDEKQDQQEEEEAKNS